MRCRLSDSIINNRLITNPNLSPCFCLFRSHVDIATAFTGTSAHMFGRCGCPRQSLSGRGPNAEITARPVGNRSRVRDRHQHTDILRPKSV